MTAFAATETGNLEGLLAELPIMMRDKAAKKAVRKANAVVVKEAKNRCPVGGPRVGRKAGKPHLRDTIKGVVRDYGEKTVGVTGPTWPDGAHGHLVEFGTEHSAPQPFLRPAADETKKQQEDAITQTLRDEIDKTANKFKG